MEQWNLGAMQCHFEEPDLLHVKLQGECDAPTMRNLMALTRELAEKHGPILMLADLSQGLTITPEARKAASQESDSDRTAALALFGGSFAMRAIGNMLLRGLAVLGKFKGSYGLFATEFEARQWLLQHRKKA